MQIRENACLAGELEVGQIIGTYGTAKLSVATIRISLNDVRIVTNMNTRHTFHVADPVPSDAIKI